MSKRSNRVKRVEPYFQSNKKDKNPSKTNSFHANGNKNEHQSGSKQVESRIQYINFKQQSDVNINRLDLIFQKQPKQIQDKLMKLLISYNAILQYNKNTDLFEVDLLLPFLNEDQKREFIRQFLEIRKNKPVTKFEEQNNESSFVEELNQNKKQGNINRSNSLNQSKEIRKFSFNNNFKFPSEFQQQVLHRQQEMMDQMRYQEQQIEQQKKKILFLHQQENRYKAQYQRQSKVPLNNVQNKKLDLKKLQQSINQRLKSAISIINHKKGKEQKNKQNQNNSRSIFISEEQSKNAESIIEKYNQSNQFNDSQKISQKNSNYIKEDIGQTQQPSQQHLFGKSHNFDEYNYAYNYQSQANRYNEIIEQQQQDEQYEPLFNKKHPNNQKNDKVTSFEDYTKKYTTLKQDKNKKKPYVQRKDKSKIDNQVNVPKNYFSSREKDQNKKSQNSFNIPKVDKKVDDKNDYKTPSKNNNQRERSRQSSSHSRSYSAHKQSPSKQSQQIKQHLNDFFAQHKQNLQTLYSQIRNKIRSQHQAKPASSKKQVERQKVPEKLAEELYILVLDDLEQQQSQNASIAQIPNSKQFKLEIIKEYKKEILINSKNLSSEDLVRYFKVLHSNAKKLYLRYLTNKPK